MKELRTRFAGAALAAMLVACGGGGGGGSPSPAVGGNTGPSPQVGLSATQATFEDAALAGNGGLVTVLPLGLIVNGTVVWQELQLLVTSLLSSPSAGPVLSSFTPGSPLFLPVSSGYQNPFDSNSGSAYVDNGHIWFVSAQAPDTYSYNDGDIVFGNTATIGVGSFSTRITKVTKVALTGRLADAPEELRGLFGPYASRFDSSAATFAPGSAYYQLTRVTVGDSLALFDYDSNPSTQPMSATPAAWGTTVGVYMSSHGGAAGGTIKTNNGALCWVSNTPDPSGAYTAFCEIAGNVYWASYTPNGTTTGSYDGISKKYLPYSIRLNKAAAASVTQMLTGS